MTAARPDLRSRIIQKLDGASALRIVAAAIRYRDPKSGVALTISLAAPARHGHIMHAAHGLGLQKHEDEQGFLDSEGNFRGRLQSLYIAKDAKQIVRRAGQTHDADAVGFLTSEDVW